MIIDFNNPDESTLELFKKGLEMSKEAAAKDPHHNADLMMARDFTDFIYATLTNMGIDPMVGKKPICVSVDYDPKTNLERFLKDGWSVQSGHWGFVETPVSYTFTMSTLLKYLRYSPGKQLRILSLGSGVGLYETYLAQLFSESQVVRARLTCMDFAPGMTRQHQKILTSLKPRPVNIKAVTGDMSNIPLPSGSMDSVICNNSLQWCLDWKKAIREMARVINPNYETPFLYLFVQNHEQGMTLRGLDGAGIISLPHVSTEEIMDELGKNNFDVHYTRQCRSPDGLGQHGATIDRIFIMARYEKAGVKKGWREKTVRTTGAQIV